MELRGKEFSKREFYQAYISEINWDWLFLKGQLVFGGIMFVGLVGFLLWFV